MMLFYAQNDKNSVLCRKNFRIAASRTVSSLAPPAIHMRLWGMVSADAKNFEKLLRERQNIILVPGGFEEATITSHKEYRVYIRERKGFVKKALQHGYKLIPIFVFNENKCFSHSDFFLR
jgi:2-acylglycerol O-acyltransferase 2